MKVNKLILQDFIKYYGDQQERLTGMTTAMALSYISQAMKRPGTKIRITQDLDCHGNEISTINYRRIKVVTDTVSDIIGKLRLQYFTIDYKPFTIVYEPFIDIEI